MKFFPDDWSSIFAFETPLFELVVRGAVLYFGILILMRVMPRRSGGELEMMDLIFALLIAEAATHAMGGYTSVSDAIILIIVMMIWNYLVNTLSYYVPIIERLIAAPPLQIIRSGKLLRRNMRREFLTEQELMSYLRQQGVEKVEDVKSAYIESEGKITVINQRDNKQSTLSGK